MTKHSLSDRPLHGRTFHTIMWVVALIATIQAFALSLAIMKRASSDSRGAGISTVAKVTVPPPLAVSPPAPVVEPIPPVAPGPPQPNRERISVAQPGSTGGVTPVPRETPPPPVTRGVSDSAPLTAPVLPEPSFIGPETAVEPLSLSAALSQAAKENALTGEPILERLLATGAELRSSGNMQGALQAFREVESALPANPRVLAELAATLSQMGLEDKASAYWESVEALGPIAAGTYFPLAGQQLRGEPALSAPSSAPATSPSPGAVILRIGAVKVEEEAPTSEGQKVTLRVVVEANPGERPVGEDLALLVYFYDQVTGGMVQSSTADTSYLYPTEPYDWQIDGREEIIVSYHQPVFTEDQKRDLGERSYYGYAIELYYRDQIQDKVAMPEDIAKLRVEPAAEPDKDEGVIGPENALFPKSVIP